METTETAYEGSAYHPSLGNEMAFGSITLSQWTLYFRSETVALDFPLQGLILDIPEKDADRITFVHSSHPEWRVYTPDFEILENRNLLSKTGIRQQIQKIGERKNNWRKLTGITVAAFAVFMIIVVGALLVTGWTLDYVVTKVPPTYEKKIGDDAFQELVPYVRFVEDTNSLQQLEMLAKQFIPAEEQRRFDFRFHIVDAPTPNAMALPGGIVLVTTDLMELADADELAGVLAHEVSHVTRRHGIKQVASTVGPYLLLKALLQNDKGFLGLLGHSSRLLISQNFSQKYEIEADEAAWEYIVKANINPRGLISCFKKFQKIEESEGAATVRALASHPPTDERIRRLEKKWNGLRRKDGFVQLQYTNTVISPW